MCKWQLQQRGNSDRLQKQQHHQPVSVQQLQRCRLIIKTRTEQKNIHERKAEPAGHIPEQTAHWLGHSFRRLLLRVYRKIIKKPNHKHSSQFRKGNSPRFKTNGLHTGLGQHLPLAPGAKEDHRRWRREEDNPLAFSPQTINRQSWAQGPAPVFGEVFPFPFPFAFQTKEEQSPVLSNTIG